MVNVDFSASILNGVSFTNRIDLSNCIFPKGDYYIYIQNLKKTIERVTQIINEEWADGYEKDTATKLIDLVYYNKDLKEQQNSFIDSFIIKAVGKEEDDQGVGMKIFNLIRSLQ